MSDLQQERSHHSSVNAWEDDGDAIWDEDDNVSYDRAIAEREWSRLNDTFGNSGYREGIEEGKEGTLQEGFNQGWSEGVHYGHELGRLRGLISPLIEYIKSLPSPPAATASTATSLLLNNTLIRLQDKDKDAWIQKASELVKELIDLDISKIFDKAFFDDGYKSTKGKSTSATTFTAESSSRPTSTSTSGAGCCGGSSSQGDSCCKKNDVADANNTEQDIEAPMNDSPEARGCCSSKERTNSCLAEDKKEQVPKPEQVIISYQARVRDLLKQVGLESMLNTA
ncbi:hypothetical protein EDD11_007460 [Mortierella claussenii]|nr:hypothetical protein EDD11_007460 [Mortierella claussenii]